MEKLESSAVIYRPFAADAAPLAVLATSALLEQEPVRLLIPDGWKRPRNFPLPEKAFRDSQEREYRPMAILEWINDELRCEAASTATRERMKKEAEKS